MIKHYQQKLAAILTFTLLSCSAPLLLSANALALENRKPEVATTEIAPLIAKLKSTDENELKATIDKLVEIGSPAISALIQALKDADVQIRARAADVLGRISLDSDLKGVPSEAKIVVPALIPLLKDSNPEVRSSAASALGGIRAEAKTAVPEFLPLLKDSQAGVRSNAAFALGGIRAEAKAAVPLLIPLLKDSDADV
ncbi:MAG TPA: HEAT repeat domain-containing protein, partial [Kamptonema sp.]|nr:HEAT repeat domain-containing protein [Kamptonema sp.]